MPAIIIGCNIPVRIYEKRIFMLETNGNMRESMSLVRGFLESLEVP
jgi:hypothetical protein